MTDTGAPSGIASYAEGTLAAGVVAGTLAGGSGVSVQEAGTEDA